MLLNCVRGITNIKIYKRTSSADIPCSDHNSFILLWINSLVFSYSLHTSSITVRYIFILAFEFITDSVDRPRFKYLLAQRIYKNRGVEIIKQRNHMIFCQLCHWLKDKTIIRFGCLDAPS